jgi:uncharacterized damage-inducible protein DinB
MTALAVELPSVPAASPAVRALRAQLESVREVVATIPPASYSATRSAVSGPIGGHVRHLLDHVRALVNARGAGFTYDSRLRGTAVERDPWAAVAEIDRLLVDLDDLAWRSPERSVLLRTTTGSDAASVEVRTTVGREVAFVIQHTVHHAAILALMLEGLGIRVPAGFGVAPSTLAHAAAATRTGA